MGNAIKNCYHPKNLKYDNSDFITEHKNFSIFGCKKSNLEFFYYIVGLDAVEDSKLITSLSECIKNLTSSSKHGQIKHLSHNNVQISCFRNQIGPEFKFTDQLRESLLWLQILKSAYNFGYRLSLATKFQRFSEDSNFIFEYFGDEINFEKPDSLLCFFLTGYSKLICVVDNEYVNEIYNNLKIILNISWKGIGVPGTANYDLKIKDLKPQIPEAFLSNQKRSKFDHYNLIEINFQETVWSKPGVAGTYNGLTILKIGYVMARIISQLGFDYGWRFLGNGLIKSKTNYIFMSKKSNLILSQNHLAAPKLSVIRTGSNDSGILSKNRIERDLARDPKITISSKCDKVIRHRYLMHSTCRNVGCSLSSSHRLTSNLNPNLKPAIIQFTGNDKIRLAGFNFGTVQLIYNCLESNQLEIIKFGDAEMKNCVNQDFKAYQITLKNNPFWCTEECLLLAKFGEKMSFSHRETCPLDFGFGKNPMTTLFFIGEKAAKVRYHMILIFEILRFNNWSVLTSINISNKVSDKGCFIFVKSDFEISNLPKAIIRDASDVENTGRKSRRSVTFANQSIIEKARVSSASVSRPSVRKLRKSNSTGTPGKRSFRKCRKCQVLIIEYRGAGLPKWMHEYYWKSTGKSSYF